PWRTRLDLVRERITVARRTTAQHVRDVHVLTPETDLAQHPRQELAGRAHEGLPLSVLVEPRRLPDEHQVGLRAPDPEHHLRPALGEPAPRARRRIRRNLGERSAHAGPSSFLLLDSFVRFVDAGFRRRGAGARSRAKRATSRPTTSGASSIGMCPDPGISTNRPSGSAPARAIAPAGGVTRSSSPTSTSAGTRTRGTAWRRSISISSGNAS